MVLSESKLQFDTEWQEDKLQDIMPISWELFRQYESISRFNESFRYQPCWIVSLTLSLHPCMILLTLIKNN